MYRVLIVDDDKLIVDDLLLLIDWNKMDCEPPEWASNGKLALQKLQSERFDIVLSDIAMPEMDGVDLIRCARQSGVDSVFLVISNYDDFAYVKEAMKLGAAEYLLKYEITPENLTEQLRYAQALREKTALQTNSATSTARPEIRAALEYIRLNYAKQITLSELASISCLSPSYFCRIFKLETGMNYSEYLNAHRIREAKRLLIESTQRTNEVAWNVGFRDYRYFTRIFKEATGLTCGEYRKAKRNTK